MVHSHCTGTEPGLVHRPMETIVPCRTVHTGLRQGQVPGPIVSYCASSVPCSGPGPILVQCEWAISLVLSQCISLTFLSPTAGTSGACWSWTCRLESSWTDRGRRVGTGWTAWTGTSAGSATSASDARTFGAASQGPLFSINKKGFLVPHNKRFQKCSHFSTMVCASSSQP